MAGKSECIAMSKPRIQFDSVSVSFDTDSGPLKVVDDFTLGINEGDFISVVGPSGCGKTTLMNLIAGFVAPTKGVVTLDGQKIEGPGRERGVIFQEYGVFPWLTVEQNILFGLQLKKSEINKSRYQEILDRYLKLMGLAEFAKSYPKVLSGGMRQRLAIARAYAVNPEFLLMDEPFGALDAQTRSSMQNLLLGTLLTEKKTVMLITHSVEEAVYLASKVVIVTARPTRIKEIIEIPFGFPRQESLKDDSEFNKLKARIRDSVMQEYDHQQKLLVQTV